MDWKEILLAKSAEMGITPDTSNHADTRAVAEGASFDPKKHPRLHVVVERKGRGGKTATIIEGFKCPPEQLKEIAAKLKSALGTGGSARGGEILIQGDCRDRVSALLTSLGFKL